MIQMTPKVAAASILRKRQQNEWILLRRVSWTVCSPMRARFQGKKGFEVLRISPRGLTQRNICLSVARKYDFFLSLLWNAIYDKKINI